MSRAATLVIGGVPTTARPGGLLLIGTASDCDLVVQQRGPGGPRSHHARLRHERGAWTLFDLGTGGATSVDAVPVTTSARLKGHGVIGLGTPPDQVLVEYATAGRSRSSRPVLIAAGATPPSPPSPSAW